MPNLELAIGASSLFFIYEKGKYLDLNQELTIPQIATLPIELYLPFIIYYLKN